MSRDGSSAPSFGRSGHGYLTWPPALRRGGRRRGAPIGPDAAVTPALPGHLGTPGGFVQRRLQEARLADPLARNGYSLIANSAATGGLGLVYWLLMARLYPTVDVGRASALYAAMNLLAAFTALNFIGALTRFIPLAGVQTRRFIGQAYGVSAVASVGVSILFVVTIRWWGASYSELGHPVAGPIFVGCVVVWAIFTLQDGVLVGLRSAFWVFVENGLFGVAKIVLLVALIAVTPHLVGIAVSWMLPVLVAVPLINVLIFGRLVPVHANLATSLPPPTAREIGRFLAGDYAGALCLLAVGGLVPVVVAARTDVKQTAYFYMAWIIAAIVDMIGISLAMSLTVEGASDASTLAVNSRASLRKLTVILLPCAVLLALFASFGLSLFGHAYAVHGAPVLVLLAIATLPRAATELYLGALRAQSRTSLVALVQAVRAVLVLGLTFSLTGTMGTIGTGVAVLASQAVIAVGISVGLWRVLTADRKRGRAIQPEASL